MQLQPRCLSVIPAPSSRETQSRHSIPDPEGVNFTVWTSIPSLESPGHWLKTLMDTFKPCPSSTATAAPKILSRSSPRKCPQAPAIPRMSCTAATLKMHQEGVGDKSRSPITSLTQWNTSTKWWTSKFENHYPFNLLNITNICLTSSNIYRAKEKKRQIKTKK